MKIIIFRKTLAYDPTFGGKHSKYKGYCLITKGVLDPGIIKNQKLIDEKIKCFCSPAKRAVESVRSGSILPELREIGFNLAKLVTKDEYENSGSQLVRERFVLFFVRDLLEESRKEIKNRLDRLLRLIIKLPDGEYVFVSHSFIMKILEAYLHEKDLFEKPEKLRGYLNPQNKTYNFGEGFEYEC